VSSEFFDVAIPWNINDRDFLALAISLVVEKAHFIAGECEAA